MGYTREEWPPKMMVMANAVRREEKGIYYNEYDENDNLIYSKSNSNYWIKITYDENNNEIYSEDSEGVWKRREYDSSNRQTSYMDSTGYWSKRTYDKNNNQVYWENSRGDYWGTKPEETNSEEKFVMDTATDKTEHDGYVYEYDENGHEVYYSDPTGYWVKSAYNKAGDKLGWVNSDGDGEGVMPEEEEIPKLNVTGSHTGGILIRSQDTASKLVFDPDKTTILHMDKGSVGDTLFVNTNSDNSIGRKDQYLGEPPKEINSEEGVTITLSKEDLSLLLATLEKDIKPKQDLIELLRGNKDI